MQETQREPSISAQWPCHQSQVCQPEDAQRNPLTSGRSYSLKFDMNPTGIRPKQFALGRGIWTMTIVIYSFFALIAVMAISDAITTSDQGARAFEVLWVFAITTSGLWLLVAEPRRVEVLPEGLRFVAPKRTVLIQWEALKSVSSPRFDLNRWSLHWRFGRRWVHTWGPYDHDFQELLALVRDNAPSADLRRAVTRRPTWGGRRSKPSSWVEPTG